MLDLWEEQGPPVHVAAAAYLGLIKKRKSKRSGPPKPFDSRNPFLVHAQKPSNDRQGDDLNELAMMLSTNGGMIM